MILNSTLYNCRGIPEIVRKPLPAAPTGSSKARISLHSSFNNTIKEDSRAPRPLREDACPASLVELVRALSQRASAGNNRSDPEGLAARRFRWT